MKARFDSPLQLTANGRKLKACGELDWNDPDSNTVIVTITVTQGGVVAAGTSPPFARGTAEWMVDLRPNPGQKFQDGQADANGMLTITDPPAVGVAHFRWDDQPDLTFDPTDT